MSRMSMNSVKGYVLSVCVVMFAGSFLRAGADASESQPQAVELCMTCHGTSGQGNPVVQAPGLDGAQQWYIRRQLEKFRAGIRGHQSDYIPGYEMRAAASALSDEQIGAIVDAIADWRPRPAAPRVDGDVGRGQQIFRSCTSCHGSGGQGIEAVGAPRLAGKSDWYLMNQLKLFRSGYRGSHPDDLAGAQMRAMSAGLSTESHMRDVVAYIMTLDRPPDED